MNPTDANPVDGLVPEGLLTVAEVMAARVRRSPDAAFVKADSGCVSYRSAWDNARSFAGWLGPRRDTERVACFLPNRPEIVWCWLGTAVAGRVWVPLHRGHRGQILHDMLARSGATVLVTDSEGREILGEALDCSRISRTLIVDEQTGAWSGQAEGWEDVLSAQSVDEPLPPVRGEPAWIVFTSGTTGRSKAVRLTHEQVCRGAGWIAWSMDMRQSDVYHLWLPMYHVAALVDTLLATIVAGGAVALYPTFSRSRFWSQIAECQATIFAGFSNVLELLWSLPQRPEDAGSTLRSGLVGRIPPELHRRFEKRFGLRLYDVYGLTELEPIALPRPYEQYPVGACGPARPDLEVAILGPEGDVLGPDQQGEIVCRTLRPKLLFDRYEDDDDATIAATTDLWFHTGDIGKMDSAGLVYFVDRLKHAIRRRGENISSWELEELIAQHPHVAECCAIGVPSPLGEDDVLVAVAPTSDASLDPPELHAWCMDRMATFMVPRYIQVHEELPRTPTGKVLKENLRDLTVTTWDAEEHSRPRPRS